MARRKPKRFLSAATPVLAGLLAGLLLLFGLLAASEQLHRAFHPNGKDGANPCLACLLIKGQVKSADPVAVVAAAVIVLFQAAPKAQTAVLPDFTYLASPSRAPPALASLLPVVA